MAVSAIMEFERRPLRAVLMFPRFLSNMFMEVRLRSGFRAASQALPPFSCASTWRRFSTCVSVAGFLRNPRVKRASNPLANQARPHAPPHRAAPVRKRLCSKYGPHGYPIPQLCCSPSRPIRQLGKFLFDLFANLPVPLRLLRRGRAQDAVTNFVGHFVAANLNHNFLNHGAGRRRTAVIGVWRFQIQFDRLADIRACFVKRFSFGDTTRERRDKYSKSALVRRFKNDFQTHGKIVSSMLGIIQPKSKHMKAQSSCGLANELTPVKGPQRRQFSLSHEPLPRNIDIVRILQSVEEIRERDFCLFENVAECRSLNATVGGYSDLQSAIVELLFESNVASALSHYRKPEPSQGCDNSVGSFRRDFVTHFKNLGFFGSSSSPCGVDENKHAPQSWTPGRRHCAQPISESDKSMRIYHPSFLTFGDQCRKMQ